MKHARIIVVLVLLALSFSGCANADYFDGTPSSEETAMAEPVLSTAPQERTTVSVSESTEIPAESTAESEIAEIPPEVSTPAAGRAPLPTESSTTESAPPKASEPPPAAPADPPSRSSTFRLGSTTPKPMPKAWDCGRKALRSIAGIHLLMQMRTVSILNGIFVPV